MDEILCEKCLDYGRNGDGFQEIASESDERGEFIEYECLECGFVTRIYNED